MGARLYIHGDVHTGALRSFSLGRLQEPAQQNRVLWHLEAEQLGVPIPAVEGQLLGTLREILRDVHEVWKGESRAQVRDPLCRSYPQGCVGVVVSLERTLLLHRLLTQDPVLSPSATIQSVTYVPP